MHNTRENKQYIKGKFNSLHPPYTANNIVANIISGHLIEEEIYSTGYSLLRTFLA